MNFKKIIFTIIFLIISVFNILYADENNVDSTTDSITITDNTDDFLDLSMEGDELVIYGAKETTQHIKTITREEIEKTNPTDLKNLLEKSCNLNIISYGIYGSQSTVCMRGLRGERISILMDGVPINSKISGQANLSLIPVSDIEEIQVIKGGSDTKYNLNGAIGGVINIITKKRKETGIKLYSSISNKFYYPDFYYEKPEDSKNVDDDDNKKFSEWYDFFDTQKLNFGLNVGNDIASWDLNMEGTRAYNHCIYKDSSDVKRRREKSEVWDADIASSLRFNLPKYMSLCFSGGYFYANKNTPGKITKEDSGFRTDQNASAAIFYDADMVGHERIDTEVIVNYQYNSLESWSESSEDKLKQDINTVNVINRWGFMAADWLTLRLGGDYTYDYVDTTNLGEHSFFNGGGYLTAEFSILSIAKIIPSVKLIATSKYPVPVPKLGFVFYLGEYFTLKNNYYRTFRLPTCGELYWPKDDMAEGNPDLIPEDGIGGDVILKFNKPKILSAESSVYVNYMKDIIVFQKRDGDVPKAENLDSAYYFGIDNEITSDFSKYVTLTASYSFLITYTITDEITFEDDKRMPYTPIHTFGFGVMFNWNNGNINFLGHYESERYYDEMNTAAKKSDPFFTLDINFSQTIKNVTLFASIKNAFNSQYFLASGYPMAGGSVTLGVKLNYEKKIKKTDENDIDNKIR